MLDRRLGVSVIRGYEDEPPVRETEEKRPLALGALGGHPQDLVDRAPEEIVAAEFRGVQRAAEEEKAACPRQLPHERQRLLDPLERRFGPAAREVDEARAIDRDERRGRAHPELPVELPRPRRALLRLRETCLPFGLRRGCPVAERVPEELVCARAGEVFARAGSVEDLAGRLRGLVVAQLREEADLHELGGCGAVEDGVA